MDELTNEPVINAVLEKKMLASQPTLFRFFHRMDKTTLEQFNQILHELRKAVHSIKVPQFMLFILTQLSLMPITGRKEQHSISITKVTATIPFLRLTV